MIAMSVPAVLFLGSCIIGSLIVGFTIGFIVGMFSRIPGVCISRENVIAVAVMVIVVSLIFVLTGCSPVVKESITITDTEKTLPVPGDTVSVTAKSDSVVWYTPDGYVLPVSPVWTPEAAAPAERRLPVYFRAFVDTTVSGVRMRVGYSYPEDTFEILIEQEMREIKYRDRDTSGMRVVDRPRDVVPIWVYFVIACALVMMVYSVVITIKARSK